MWVRAPVAIKSEQHARWLETIDDRECLAPQGDTRHRNGQYSAQYRGDVAFQLALSQSYSVTTQPMVQGHMHLSTRARSTMTGRAEVRVLGALPRDIRAHLQ